MLNPKDPANYWGTEDKERRDFILEYASTRVIEGVNDGGIPDFLLIDRMMCELARL